MILKCEKCGWVHMGRTRAEVEAEVASFNAYFATLDQEGREAFGNRESRIESYMKCFRCGAPNTFALPADPDDCPRGSTIQPILDPLWN